VTAPALPRADSAAAPAAPRGEPWISPLAAAASAELPPPATAAWRTGPPSEAALRSPDVGEALAERATAASGPPEEAPSAEPSDSESAEEGHDEPSGRTLADLYFAQGHYAEALDIYDELVAANPFDGELKRLRRDAEARLLPAATATGHADADPALNRRLSRVRALKQWLSVVQAG